MTINIEENIFDNCQNGEDTYFYYLRFNYTPHDNKMTFKITEMPEIYFKSSWNEFDIINKKTKSKVDGVDDYMLNESRMVILDKNNIEIGKRMVLDKFYKSLDKQIESIESTIRSLYTSIEDIKKLQNSSMFRYKKLEKLLQNEGLKAD